MTGDYRTSGITFTSEDSGTETCPVRYCKYGDGEVTINGGVTLNPEDFSAITDEEMLSRLNDDAKKNVLQVDLSKYGLSKEDYGKIHAIGVNQTACKYDGDFNYRDYSNDTITKKEFNSVNSADLLTVKFSSTIAVCILQDTLTLMTIIFTQEKFLK